MKALFGLAILILSTNALNNGEALTPAMGWNSWNYFNCGINEEIAMQIADAMVSTGLLQAGYKYLNIDDCWAYSRYPNGTIQADPTTFPQGMAYLANYVHSQGLKFGIYSDAGTNTCQGRPGSLTYEQIDASTYAEWGVDYLKYDNCNNLNIPPQIRYPIMTLALNMTKAPIYFSMCEWGLDAPWFWASGVSNSWRVSGDIQDNWESVAFIIEWMVAISSDGGIGGWNDPDMLEVGNGNMTTTEYQTHFAMWAYLKAPLIIGCDVRNMSNDTMNILMNPEVIAINQDPLGVPAIRVNSTNNNEEQVWAGPLSDGVAVILYNPGANASNITVQFSWVNVTGPANFRDLIAHQNLGTFNGSFTGLVQSHGCMALKVTNAENETSELLFLSHQLFIINI